LWGSKGAFQNAECRTQDTGEGTVVPAKATKVLTQRTQCSHLKAAPQGNAGEPSNPREITVPVNAVDLTKDAEGRRGNRRSKG